MNDTRVTQYLAGRQAFAFLTGTVDKAAQKVALVDGYKALASLADDMSLREIVAAAGLSKGKVERDVRAARLIVDLPKVDAVLIVKACNADGATAAALAKATADKAKARAGLKAILDKANEKARESRAARNAGGTDASNDPKAPKAPKGPQSPAKVVTLESLPAWLASRDVTSKDVPLLDAIIAACEVAKVKARNNRAA